MSKSPRSIRNDHLPYPREYREDDLRQKRLDAFFRSNFNGSAVDRLRILNERFGIGGAPPRVSRRGPEGDPSSMFVVRHSDSGEQMSTGVRAINMTIEDALRLDKVKDTLETFAADKLFEFQAQHAPGTLPYSTILRRFLAAIDPNSSDPERNKAIKELNKSRNIPDVHLRFQKDASRAEFLIAHFFHDRTLKFHHYGIPSQIKSLLVRRARDAGAERDVGGQYAGASDVNVETYVSVVRRALAWLLQRYRPGIQLPMEALKKDIRRSVPLMWADARLIILWSRGYVWEDGGFAREWVWRNGDWRLEWKREGPEFRAKYKPLLRHVLTYTLTGARLTCALNMGWRQQNYRGSINLDTKEFARGGALSPQPKNKPRVTTIMLPFVRGIFANWFVIDSAMARNGRCESTDHSYVIHNGRGGPARNVPKRLGEACEALGLHTSSHKMKVANVTQLYLAGFDLYRAAILVGNDAISTSNHYLYLREQYEGVERPNPDGNTMTFTDLVNPIGELPKIPRAPAPPRPRGA